MIDIMLLLLTMPPDETFMIFFIILSHLVVRAKRAWEGWALACHIESDDQNPLRMIR